MAPGPGPDVHPKTSSMLDHDVLPIPCMRLSACAQPSTSDTLDKETCKLCHELTPLPVPVPLDPELICHEHEQDLNVLLILVSKAVLPLHEPGREALGLGCDKGGDRRPTESSHLPTSSEPSGDGWPECNGQSSSWSSSGTGSEPTMLMCKC
jgi:hypothetical protein